MVNLFLVRNLPGMEKTVIDANKATGYLGKMFMDGLEFDTLERAQNYVRLPVGVYQLQMYQSSKLGQVLRPLTSDGKELSGKKNKIRIHAASIPSHLQGCIAPGYRNSKNSGLPFQGSRTILNMILLACGRWENLKIVGSLFVIEDYTPPNIKYAAHLLEPEALSRFSIHNLLKSL
jgi:hypothetical protein